MHINVVTKEFTWCVCVFVCETGRERKSGSVCRVGGVRGVEGFQIVSFVLYRKGDGRGRQAIVF